MVLVKKEEIMEMLKISKGKLDSMIKNDEIKYYKMGRVIRFDVDEVIEYLKK